VVVIDLTEETMALSVVSQPASVVVEFKAIVESHKYKGLHKGTILFR
jgi:hypothetical protein